MIYEFPDISSPIRQGDIFAGLPWVEVSLLHVRMVEEGGVFEAQWSEVMKAGEAVAAVLPVKPVTAIVATQDCDNAQGKYVTLCEIRSFCDVEGKARDTQKTKGWVSILTQHSRLNLKWFYIPPCDRMGFSDKLAVDFAATIRVPRTHLEEMRRLRRGRLNPTAEEHFRERIAEFFRRYAYDEWYPLDREELAEYRKRYPDADPFPWQS